MSTLRASFKLWLGWPAHRSGVFSAGNGPAMRAGIIGAAFPDDAQRREEYVHASTLITHTDPRAQTGSLAVAECIAGALRGGGDPQRTLYDLRRLAGSGDTEWPDLIDWIDACLERGKSVAEFADSLGLERGVSGYVYHTVPVALFAAMRHVSYERGLTAVLDLGGDTDTVGAILGALSGAVCGRKGIPAVAIKGARRLYVARTYAYVAAGSRGLVIVDVERPEQPTIYDEFTAGGQINDARDVKIGMTNASVFAYVADGHNGLRVIQLISPKDTPEFGGFSPQPKPRLIATFHTHEPALALSKGLDRDRAVDETGHQVAVFGRIGARPLNDEEQKRLYLRGDGKALYTVSDEVPQRPDAGD